MIYIFDLDYTLLDTARFKKDLAEVFNMSEDEFKKDYSEHFKNKGINYSLGKHLEILMKEKGISEKQAEEIEKGFENFISHIDDYLYPEAERILKKYQSKGRIILASFGDIGWQEQKVSHLKISRYFEQVLCEDKNKSRNEILKTLKDSGEEIIIVNDNAEESEKMKEVLGKKCSIYLIDGPYSHNIEHEQKIHELKEMSPKERRKPEPFKEMRPI